MLYKVISHRPWYGWLIAVLSLVIVAVSNGMTNAGMSVFDESLLDTFGWTVGELKLRDSINFWGAAVLILLSGYLVDRIGYKPLLLVGMTCLAMAYIGFSEVQSLWQVYALHGVFALVIACSGNMVAIVTAASAMPHRRGLAVGIALAGTSVGGMVIPPLASHWIESIGWRTTLRTEAFIPVVMFLVILFFLKNKTANKKVQDSSTQGIEYGQAVRTVSFYLIAIAGGMTFFAIVSLYSHLFLFMRSLQFPPQTAALGFTALSIAALVGKIGAGFLSDRASPYTLLRLNLVVMFVGLVWTYQLPILVWWGLVITGLGWGSLHTLYNYVLIALFGMRAVGKINATVAIFQSAGAGLGAAVTGFLFDSSGSYTAPFALASGLLVLSLLLTLPVRPLQRPSNH